MLRLAMPVMVEELLHLLVGYTDWWLTGHYLEGPSYKAAMGLMAYTMWLMPTLFATVAIGALALTSRFIGAGDRKGARQVTGQAMLMGIVVAALATLAAVLFGERFVAAMQLKEDAAPLAVAYLWILIPAIPAIMVEQVTIACLRGAGDTVSGLFAKTIVNAVNLVLSVALVTGWGPFPDLGFRGLAIGTACGHAVGALILLAILTRGRAGLQLRLPRMRPDVVLMRRLLRIGIPGGIDALFIIACHLTYAAIINATGTLDAAAHGLGVQIEALAFLPGSAFHVAAATMAGQYLGAGDEPRAVRGVVMACVVGGGIMTSAGLAFFFGGEFLTSFFTGTTETETAQLTTRLLKIVAVSEPFLAVAMVLTGALRGSGDTRWPLLITLIGLVGVRIPFACLLAWDEIAIPLTSLTITGYGLGVVGAWYAMVADVVLRSLLVTYRFFHGGWKRIKV
jgi:putative MATE family efflux protein